MAETIAPDLMTIDELVSRLGLGKTKVNEMHLANELPFPTVRIGGRVMFSRRAYESWLSEYDYQGGRSDTHDHQDI